MVLLRKIILVLVSIFIEVHSATFDDSISFHVYPQNGKPLKYTNSNYLRNLGCSSTKPWVMIVHGYRYSPNISKWPPVLAAKFSKFRGGCVIMMDYTNYTYNKDYTSLVGNFEAISGVLGKKLNQMFKEDFHPQNGLLFGFSFGAELVFDVGIKTGGKIARIDACDPPGFGFEDATRDPKRAAKNVQCIHTSTSLGTTKRDCHQNWLMGNCGVSQPAVGYILSHGACTDIYISAFENNFFAEANPMQCTKNVGTIATSYPSKLFMGYKDTRISEVRGTLFSRTYVTENFAAS